ncbi:FeoA family protein [Domibacillus robiginosus]|uniref:FeoA family protein n=1 Tax=Domibacillus robiginosus TaxID=1071054 RepID=UPI00067DD023|nr:FeoA family protein [Domibacillus robiginosus]
MYKVKTQQNLYQAKTGEEFFIKKVEIKGELKRRLLGLGFVPGSTVEILKKSLLGDPISYMVAGTFIALRKEERRLIFGKVIDL